MYGVTRTRIGWVGFWFEGFRIFGLTGLDPMFQEFLLGGKLLLTDSYIIITPEVHNAAP